MIGLFRVHYFDPKLRESNTEAHDVLARNAIEAIRKADRMKSRKKYRVQSVNNLGFSDE